MWIKMLRVTWYFFQEHEACSSWQQGLFTGACRFPEWLNNSSNNKKLLLLRFTLFWLLCCLNLWIRFYSTVRVDMLNIWKMFVQNYTSGKLATDLLSLTPLPSRPEMPTSHHNPNQTSEGEKEAGLQVLKISACSKKRHEHSSLFISLPLPFLIPQLRGVEQLICEESILSSYLWPLNKVFLPHLWCRHWFSVGRASRSQFENDSRGDTCRKEKLWLEVDINNLYLARIKANQHSDWPRLQNENIFHYGQ